MNPEDCFAKNFADLFDDIIGNNIQFDCPIKLNNKQPTKNFIIYSDFTASGKSLKSIETVINDKVLPTYGNVHSTVGHNAEITSKLLQDAKDKLRNYTNAYGNYSIIFHGQGATGGVSKLIEMLNIKKYINFYNDLKVAFELKPKIGVDLKDYLIRRIKSQFKDLFFNVNFYCKCRKEDYETIQCILCKKDMKNDCYYDKHIEDKEHKNNLEQYIKNPEKKLFEMNYNSITDFIETILNEYFINSSIDIDKLINDYKKFEPVVFLSIYEHNSNSLNWKETQCEIVTIAPENFDEFYSDLEKKLEEYKDRYIKIGSFTASSNITGLLLDVDRISFLMHKNNGFAFFDYAATAPYLKIDLNKPLPDEYRKLLGFSELADDEKSQIFKDGIFFSPHKFLGGPGTPGILIVHDRIYRNQLKPTQPGGGTVNYVYDNKVDYIHDVEFKEESGTPNIIGIIRTGLVIDIRQEISHDHIILRDKFYSELFLKELKNIPNLYILHSNLLNDKPHIPIFSFMISFDKKYLHPNYICSLLNDLFGIQSRPGCSCAPNYGRKLLGFDKDDGLFELLEYVIREGNEIFKPGYLRLNLPYFYPEYVIRYIIDAIKFICKHGYKFLGLYYYDINSGRFYNKGSQYKNVELNLKAELKSAKEGNSNSNIFSKEINIAFNNNAKKMTEKELNKIKSDVDDFISSKKYLNQTFEICDKRLGIINLYFQTFDDRMENARWFYLFKDIRDFIIKIYQNKDNEDEYNKLIKEFEQEKTKPIDYWAIQNQKINQENIEKHENDFSIHVQNSSQELHHTNSQLECQEKDENSNNQDHNILGKKKKRENSNYKGKKSCNKREKNDSK